MKKFLFYLTIALIAISCQNQSKQLIKEGIAEVNGTKIYYEMAGSGETLVLVHGNAGDRRHWDFQFMPLAKEFNVIRYDVRGFGKSALPDPEEPFSHREDLKALLDHFGIQKAHICGISMGSGIVVDFAIDYPDMCKSLISVGPWINGYKSPAADTLFAIMANVGSIVREKGSKEATDYFLTGNNTFKDAFRMSKTVEHMKMVGYDYSYWYFINKSKTNPLKPTAITQLDKIKIPTLIVTAEYDLEASKEVAKIMEKEITGSKIVSIENAGHAMNMDKPDEFNEVLIKFIKNLEYEITGFNNSYQ
jgi:3-oxoadipate enol-lactonase